jgi:hypothetical protein
MKSYMDAHKKWMQRFCVHLWEHPGFTGRKLKHCLSTESDFNYVDVPALPAFDD